MKTIYLVQSDEYHDNPALYAVFTDRVKAEHAAEVAFPGAAVEELPLDPELKPAHTVYFYRERWTEVYNATTSSEYEFQYNNGGWPEERERLFEYEFSPGHKLRYRLGWGLTPEAAKADFIKHHGPLTKTT